MRASVATVCIGALLFEQKTLQQFSSLKNCTIVLQPNCPQVPGHVEHGCHHLRLSLRHLPIQRGWGHQRADPERLLHVPAQSLEGDQLPGHRAHHQPPPGLEPSHKWFPSCFLFVLCPIILRYSHQHKCFKAKCPGKEKVLINIMRNKNGYLFLKIFVNIS